MKKLAAVVLVLIVVGLGAFWWARHNSNNPESEVTEAAPTVAPPVVAAETEPVPAPKPAPDPGPVTQPRLPKPVVPAVAPVVENLDDPAFLKQSVAILVSAESPFAQKQAEWKKWREAGKLDAVIAELKQQAADHPTDAAYPAALGQGYIFQIAAVPDVRDRAILGMQADKSFDAALELDPQNWDARFFKTAALAHWPAEMNKGPEVIASFTKLIEQQEAMPTPQPQFAQSYIRLGEQYEKAGQLDNAKQVWQRGAAMFPDNSALKQKLAPPPAPGN